MTFWLLLLVLVPLALPALLLFLALVVLFLAPYFLVISLIIAPFLIYLWSATFLPLMLFYACLTSLAGYDTKVNWFVRSYEQSDYSFCDYQKIPGTCPIVVDLDHTLAKIDFSWETWKRATLSQKIQFLWNHGIFYRDLTELFDPSGDWIGSSLRWELVELLKKESKNRQIILATGSPLIIANTVADLLGLFDAVLASQPGSFCIGPEKLRRIGEVIDGPFVYIGDSANDCCVWEAAEHKIVLLQKKNRHLVAKWKSQIPDLVVINCE